MEIPNMFSLNEEFDVFQERVIEETVRISMKLMMRRWAEVMAVKLIGDEVF